MTRSERRYCVTKRELLAVVDALKHFKTYLYGVPFVVRSDHGSLRWLLNFKDLQGQLGRWSEYLGTYNFTLIHRSGKLHGNADSLSRRPCGDCKHCLKVEARVENQEADVDCCCHRLRKVAPRESEKCWVEGKTLTDLQSAQEVDPCIGPVWKWKKDGVRPKWAEIARHNIIVKTYWSQWDRLVLRDDVLYRKWWTAGTDEVVCQLILPETLKSLVLEQLHGQPSSGHLGIRRTLARVRSRFYWVGLLYLLGGSFWYARSGSKYCCRCVGSRVHLSVWCSKSNP